MSSINGRVEHTNAGNIPIEQWQYICIMQMKKELEYREIYVLPNSEKFLTLEEAKKSLIHFERFYDLIHEVVIYKNNYYVIVKNSY
ncbi:hypothetical protein UFOVP1290_248 [uncultured Caudovirales phage]|uniref:Uncharacterized protein n=1 Tax=uncultured Caudovirales phage TaxID=2100421 RepID=A0A6J5RT11_9CAUD|nr:hypothetical protein UFOVP1290_248 [uncultured Caudovirales phage]